MSEYFSDQSYSQRRKYNNIRVNTGQHPATFKDKQVDSNLAVESIPYELYGCIKKIIDIDNDQLLHPSSISVPQLRLVADQEAVTMPISSKVYKFQANGYLPDNIAAGIFSGQNGRDLVRDLARNIFINGFNFLETHYDASLTLPIKDFSIENLYSKIPYAAKVVGNPTYMNIMSVDIIHYIISQLSEFLSHIRTYSISVVYHVNSYYGKMYLDVTSCTSNKCPQYSAPQLKVYNSEEDVISEHFQNTPDLTFWTVFMSGLTKHKWTDVCAEQYPPATINGTSISDISRTKKYVYTSNTLKSDAKTFDIDNLEGTNGEYNYYMTVKYETFNVLDNYDVLDIFDIKNGSIITKGKVLAAIDFVFETWKNNLQHIDIRYDICHYNCHTAFHPDIYKYSSTSALKPPQSAIQDHHDYKPPYETVGYIRYSVPAGGADITLIGGVKVKMNQLIDYDFFKLKAGAAADITKDDIEPYAIVNADKTYSYLITTSSKNSSVSCDETGCTFNYPVCINRNINIGSSSNEGSRLFIDFALTCYCIADSYLNADQLNAEQQKKYKRAAKHFLVNGNLSGYEDVISGSMTLTAAMGYSVGNFAPQQGDIFFPEYRLGGSRTSLAYSSPTLSAPFGFINVQPTNPSYKICFEDNIKFSDVPSLYYGGKVYTDDTYENAPFYGMSYDNISGAYALLSTSGTASNFKLNTTGGIMTLSTFGLDNIQLSVVHYNIVGGDCRPAICIKLSGPTVGDFYSSNSPNIIYGRYEDCGGMATYIDAIIDGANYQLINDSNQEISTINLTSITQADISAWFNSNSTKIIQRDSPNKFIATNNLIEDNQYITGVFTRLGIKNNFQLYSGSTNDYTCEFITGHNYVTSCELSGIRVKSTTRANEAKLTGSYDIKFLTTVSVFVA